MPDATPLAEVTTRLEAERFGRYLTGKPIASQLADRYVAAMDRLQPAVSARDRQRIRFALDHPRLLGILDAGLALRDPRSVLRWKLLVMTAILEATPEYADRFLPQSRWPLYAAYAAFVGVRAGLKGAIGVVLVTFVR